MVKFTNRDYPNFHINIIGDKLEVIVTLNIKPDMIPFLPATRICKMKKHWVYFLKSNAPMQQMSEARILSMANVLINSAMIDCRKAKQFTLKAEIEVIKTQTPRINAYNYKTV